MHPMIDQMTAEVAAGRGETSEKIRELSADYIQVMQVLLSDLGLTNEQIGAVTIVTQGAIYGKVVEGETLEDVCMAVCLAATYLFTNDPKEQFSA